LFGVFSRIFWFVVTGSREDRCRIISCLVYNIIYVSGSGVAAISDAGDTVATFLRGLAISEAKG
ncbi:hypothetical protein NL488_27675, partial [Klebsiella pneumoniae]|nr:hypothetical protein [Klebsiella pneumoniae]